MKNIIIICFALIISIGQNNAQCPSTCTPGATVLSGTLSSRTLNPSDIYLLRGCVLIPSGVSVTIPAGTLIMGEKNTYGTLVIQRGGQLISQGTAGNPVVFTSDQTEACRAPNDWGGIIVAGRAGNNAPAGVVGVTRGSCVPVEGGGTDDADHSGVYKYMRIEYGSGLSMLSVGGQTILEHVEIAHAGENALELYGGTVNFKNLVFFDNNGYDIVSSMGNRSLAQSIVILRKTPSAFLSSGSAGILIKNNDDEENDFEGRPGSANTHPVFSNVTIYGPELCSSQSQNEFKGVVFTNRAEGEIYNSYISGAEMALEISENYSVENAALSGLIKFEFNSLNGNRLDAYSDMPAWPGLCTDIDMWLQGAPCSQAGNETGQPENISLTLCGDYCSTAPSLAISFSDIEAPNYASLGSPFFMIYANRGGVDAVDWTSPWARFCTPGYCPPLLQVSSSERVIHEAPGLSVYPNPAVHSVNIDLSPEAFDHQAMLKVVNVTGQVVFEQSLSRSEGWVSLQLDVGQWSAGVYQVVLYDHHELILSETLVVK